MFDDGQPQAGPFFLGGEVRLKNLGDLVAGDAGPVIGDADEHRVGLAHPGGDVNIATAAHGFPRVLQEVDEGLRKVHALHQQGRQGRGIIPMQFHFVLHRGRKHAEDGLFHLFGNVQFFHAALDQSGVAHQLSNDPVRPFDLFANDLNLLGDGFALLDRALQREGRVIDDAQRILELVRDLGRQPARRLQLLLALRELDRFFIDAALLVEQHLQSITTERHQQQHRHPEDVRLVGLFRELRLDLGDRPFHESSPHKAAAQHQIEHNLGGGDGNAHGRADDQRDKHPVNHAVKSAGHHRHGRPKQDVNHRLDQDHFTDQLEGQFIHPDQDDGRSQVDDDVNHEKQPDRQQHGFPKRVGVVKPFGKKQRPDQQGYECALDRQDDISLDRPNARGLMAKIRRVTAQPVRQT